MKYFTLEELTRSDVAKREGIDNTPDLPTTEALTALVEDVLDPLREMYGHPIHVTSGYRCEELNKAVGGAKTSQHLRGEAADIHTGKRGENAKLYRLIKKYFDYDQLIWEKGDDYEPSWVHVSYKAEGGNRKQVLRIR
jgi:zinc D-Ala-D-Ala carboxypeptidase